MNNLYEQEKRYKILKLLSIQANLSQREMAKRTGISLGKTNYVLTELANKDIIKIKRFKSAPSKIPYSYMLTPAHWSSWHRSPEHKMPEGLIALSNRPSRFGKKPKSSRPWRLCGSISFLTKNKKNLTSKPPYSYMLTPHGLEEKTKITLKFLKKKLNECEEIKHQIREITKEVEKDESIGFTDTATLERLAEIT